MGDFSDNGVGLNDTFCAIIGLSEFGIGVEYENGLLGEAYEWIQSVFSDTEGTYERTWVWAPRGSTW
jgi:hypothetical protein